jgi:type IV secretory pathway TraG/TraD family ATPase VirD4
MITWLTTSWWQFLIVGVVLLIAVGAGLTLLVYIIRAMFALIGLTHRGMRWGWATLTGTPPSTHGTAHFATASEIATAGLLNTSGMPLARWHGQTLREPTNSHVVLIAPPRSHKSFGVIMPVLRQWTGSAVGSLRPRS